MPVSEVPVLSCSRLDQVRARSVFQGSTLVIALTWQYCLHTLVEDAGLPQMEITQMEATVHSSLQTLLVNYTKMPKIKCIRW